MVSRGQLQTHVLVTSGRFFLFSEMWIIKLTLRDKVWGLRELTQSHLLKI